MPAGERPGAGAGRDPAGHIAELQTLLDDVSRLGLRHRRLTLIVVEWPKTVDGKPCDWIVAPRAYRHPMWNNDPEETRVWSTPRGIVRLCEGINRPGDRRAYLILADAEDPDPEGETAEFTMFERHRPDLIPLLNLFRRAGRTVQHLPGMDILESRHRSDARWLLALLELCEPDERATWGEPARLLTGLNPPRDHEFVAPIERNCDPSLPVYTVFTDAVHASQVALRHLLAEAEALVPQAGHMMSSRGRDKRQSRPQLLAKDDVLQRACEVLPANLRRVVKLWDRKEFASATDIEQASRLRSPARRIIDTMRNLLKLADVPIQFVAERYAPKRGLEPRQNKNGYWMVVEETREDA